MGITVNGEEIPESAIQYELARLVTFYAEHMSREQVREQMPALRRRAREQAVGAKLLIAEAERLDIRVDPADIDAHLARMVEDAGGREAFDRVTAKQGLTTEALRDSIARGRRVNLLVERIGAEAGEPTEADMRAHFEAHAAEYALPDRVQAQHILLRVAEGDDKARRAARARLGEIRARVLAGANFADEAAAHSECPSGRRTGGSLGWISRGTMVPEFEDAAFAMQPGGLSDPVETPLGMHLIRKIAEERGGPADYDAVRDRIRDFLRHVRRGEAVKAYVEELRARARIEETE